jgi:hypothetical protein
VSHECDLNGAFTIVATNSVERSVIVCSGLVRTGRIKLIEHRLDLLAILRVSVDVS